MRMGHKTISVRAVPDCSRQDNAFFVHDFFSRVICVEPSHRVWKPLCIIIYKMQNPVHSWLDTGLKAFPGLLFSDKGFPKETSTIILYYFHTL